MADYYLVCMSTTAVHREVSLAWRWRFRIGCWFLGVDWRELLVTVLARRHPIRERFMTHHGTMNLMCYRISGVEPETSWTREDVRGEYPYTSLVSWGNPIVHEGTIET